MKAAIALLLLTRAIPSPGDTIVDLRVGDHLILQDLSGSVSVESWDRDELRVEVGEKGENSVRVRRSGGDLDLRFVDDRERDREARLRLTVPAWLDLTISGREVEVEIRGVDGEISVRNLEGDLLLINLGGAVSAYTAQGSIEAHGLTGEGKLRTGEDDIWVTESTASLELRTVDGDITLMDMDAPRIQARTTDGEIEFSGHILGGGDYGFYSHEGDIDLEVRNPVNLDATVTVYGGEFVSDFPVRAQSLRTGEGLMFSLGSGGARLVVETFDGDVRFLESGMRVTIERFGVDRVPTIRRIR